MEQKGEVVVGLIALVFKIIMFFMVFIFLASVSGFDSCSCGYGPEVRKTLHSIISGK